MFCKSIYKNELGLAKIFYVKKIKSKIDEGG